MPPHDSKPPAPPVEAEDAPRTFTTKTGVQVVVQPPPPRPPKRSRAREPVEWGPQAIILPEGQTDEERRAFLNSLCKHHEAFVEMLLERRKDVLEESRKDLRQRVLVILCNHVAKTRTVPENVEAWLGAVVQKEVKNHKDLWRPPVEEGADAEAVPQSSGPAAEGAADIAARRAKLERCLAHLPEDQAAVIRCLELFEMSLEEAATGDGQVAEHRARHRPEGRGDAGETDARPPRRRVRNKK